MVKIFKLGLTFIVILQLVALPVIAMIQIQEGLTLEDFGWLCVGLAAIIVTLYYVIQLWVDGR